MAEYVVTVLSACDDTPLEGVTVTLTPLVGSPIFDDTDASGQVAFGTDPGPAGTYTVTVALTGWTQDGVPPVTVWSGPPFFITPSPAAHTITMTPDGGCPGGGTLVLIVELWDGCNPAEMLEGYTVTLHYPDGTTDTQTADPWPVIWNDLEPGFYWWTVELDGYVSLTGEFEISGDPEHPDDYSVYAYPEGGCEDDEGQEGDLTVIVQTSCEPPEPLAGAFIYLVGLDGTVYTVTTDADGEYVFTDLPAGWYRYVVERNGYSTAVGSVQVPDDSPLTIELTPERGCNDGTGEDPEPCDAPPIAVAEDPIASIANVSALEQGWLVAGRDIPAGRHILLVAYGPYPRIGDGFGHGDDAANPYYPYLFAAGGENLALFSLWGSLGYMASAIGAGTKLYVGIRPGPFPWLPDESNHWGAVAVEILAASRHIPGSRANPRPLHPLTFHTHHAAWSGAAEPEPWTDGRSPGAPTRHILHTETLTGVLVIGAIVLMRGMTGEDSPWETSQDAPTLTAPAGWTVMGPFGPVSADHEADIHSDTYLWIAHRYFEDPTAGTALSLFAGFTDTLNDEAQLGGYFWAAHAVALGQCEGEECEQCFRIFDRCTGEPVEGVSILVQGEDEGVTDADGEVCFTVEPGTYQYLVDISPGGVYTFSIQGVFACNGEGPLVPITHFLERTEGCGEEECPEGTIWHERFGFCLPVCEDTEDYNPETGRCEEVCPEGERWDPVTETCVTDDCPPGTVWNPALGACRPFGECPTEGGVREINTPPCEGQKGVGVFTGEW